MSRKFLPVPINSSSLTEQSAVRRSEKQEDTRSQIATHYIWAYIGVIILLLIATTFFRLPTENVKDFLLAMGSPLGFIIGYYFKSAGRD